MDRTSNPKAKNEERRVHIELFVVSEIHYRCPYETILCDISAFLRGMRSNLRVYIHENYYHYEMLSS